MTHQNKTRHEAGQNIIQSSSAIVAALSKLPEAMFAVAIGCWLGAGAFELVRWLGGSQ